MTDLPVETCCHEAVYYKAINFLVEGGGLKNYKVQNTLKLLSNSQTFPKTLHIKKYLMSSRDHSSLLTESQNLAILSNINKEDS